MKSEKETYLLLNQTEVDFHDYEEVELSYFEKQTILKQLKKDAGGESSTHKKKLRVRLLSVAAIFCLLLSGFPPVQAAFRSILESVRYTISQAIGNDQVGSNATLSFSQVRPIGEIDIKVEDMLYFEDRIMVNILVDLDQSAAEQRFVGFGDISVMINGVDATLSPGGSSGQLLDKNNNIYSHVQTVYLDADLIMAEELEVALRVEDIFVDSPSPIEGIATFTIETSKEALSSNMTRFDIGEELSAWEYNYEVESLVVNPVFSFMKVHSDNMNSDDYQLNEIRGTDDKGDLVVFEPYNYSQTEQDWEGIFAFSYEQSEMTVEELSESEYLDLQFYSAGHPEGSGADYQPYGEKFRVEIGQP